MLIVKQSEPLNKLDKLNETFGCRHSNWNLCKHAYTSECSFTRKDQMCFKPPKSWIKLYNKKFKK